MAANSAIACRRGWAPGLPDGESGQSGVSPPPGLGRHLIEQVLLVAHVPVERGRLDSQPAGNGAHGHAVDTGVVQDVETRLHHRRLAEPLSHVDSLTKLSQTECTS